MKAFFDTSVLLATFYNHHQFHQPSIDLIARFRKNEAGCGAHSLAEIYSSLTGRTGRERVSGAEAMLFLGDLLDRLTVVSLDYQEYFKILEAASALGIAGGAIYDTLLGHCALKAKAQTIYTWNMKDFVRLGSTIATRVKTPAE
jgi:predicted nucleic acid-binding protein